MVIGEMSDGVGIVEVTEYSSDVSGKQCRRPHFGGVSEVCDLLSSFLGTNNVPGPAASCRELPLLLGGQRRDSQAKRAESTPTEMTLATKMPSNRPITPRSARMPRNQHRGTITAK